MTAFSVRVKGYGYLASMLKGASEASFKEPVTVLNVLRTVLPDLFSKLSREEAGNEFVVLLNGRPARLDETVSGDCLMEVLPVISGG